MTPEAVIDDMIRAGDGLVLGRTLRDLWPREHDEFAFVIGALQFPGPPANEKDHRTVEAFLRWQIDEAAERTEPACGDAVLAKEPVEDFPKIRPGKIERPPLI